MSYSASALGVSALALSTLPQECLHLLEVGWEHWKTSQWPEAHDVSPLPALLSLLL